MNRQCDHMRGIIRHDASRRHGFWNPSMDVLRSISMARLDGEDGHRDEFMKRIRIDCNFNREARYAPRSMSQSDRARLQLWNS